MLLTAFADGLIDLASSPVRQLPPLAGLALISLVTSAAMLLVFRATSNQRRIVDVKRHIQAAVFEIRLFNDDVRAVFRALGEVLRHNLTYLRLTLVPAACMLVLLVPVVAQLESLYGYQGLYPGEPVLVTARLRESGGAHAGPGGRPVATLQAPAGIEVQTPAVWLPAPRQLVWRIAPHAAGAYDLQVLVGGERISKRVHVSTAVVRRSPVRLGPGVLNRLRSPAEPPLPADGPLTALGVGYPDRRIGLFGWRVHWLVVYVLFSLAWTVVLRGPMRVTL